MFTIYAYQNYLSIFGKYLVKTKQVLKRIQAICFISHTAFAFLKKKKNNLGLNKAFIKVNKWPSNDFMIISLQYKKHLLLLNMDEFYQKQIIIIRINRFVFRFGLLLDNTNMN